MSLSKKTYLQLLQEKTEKENSRKMDSTTFKELLDAGEIGLILADGGTNLTKEQLKIVKQKADEMSADLLMQRQMKQATQPGYEKSIMAPLKSKILSDLFSGKKSESETGQKTLSQTQPVQRNVGPNKPKPSQKLKDKVSSSFGFNTIQKEDISPTLSTPSSVLTDILKIMVKADEEKKLEYDKEKNFFEQKQKKSEKRHEELIKALTGRVGVAEKLKEKIKLKYTFNKIIKSVTILPFLSTILKKIPPIRQPAPSIPIPKPPTPARPAEPVKPPAPPTAPTVPPTAPTVPPTAPTVPPTAPTVPPTAPTVPPTVSKPPGTTTTPPTGKPPAEIGKQQANRRAAEEAARRGAERSKEQAAKEGFRKSERDADRAATERAQREATERAQRAQKEAAEKTAREDAARRAAEAQRRRDTRETDQEEAAKEAAKSAQREAAERAQREAAERAAREAAERAAREQAARRAAEAERRRDIRESESEEAAKEAAKSAQREARQRQQQQQQQQQKQQQQPTARPEAPSVPPASAQRIPQTAQSGRVGSVVIGSLAITIAERVAAAESIGNYNISNKPAPKVITDASNRTGFARPPFNQNTDHIIIKGNVDVTKSSPNNIVYFTKNLTEMTIIEVCELAERRSVYYRGAGAGAAVGKYQFMGHGGVPPKSPYKSVLEGYAKSVFGFGWENIIYDEQVQEILQQSLLQDNARYIVNSNQPLTDISLYLSHFLGYGGGKKLIDIMGNGEIRGANPNQLMGDYMSEVAKKANSYVADSTLAQYLNNLKKKGFNGKNFTLEELKKGVILPKPIPVPQKVSYLNHDTAIDEIESGGFELFAMQRNLNNLNETNTVVSSNGNLELKNREMIYNDRPMLFRVGNFVNLYENDSSLYEKKLSPIVQS